MSDAKHNGGPAFPQNDLSSYGMGPAECNNGGMTLRDWFAGQAMAAELVAWGNSSTEGHEINIARRAFAMADAMLEARK
jgi:hypothetical protein